MRTKNHRQMVTAVVVALALFLSPVTFAVVQDEEGVVQTEQSGNWAPLEWFVQVLKSIVTPGVGAPETNSEFSGGSSTADTDVGPGMDPNSTAKP